MGRWGDGEMGRWGDGEMGKWGDGEMGRRFNILITKGLPWLSMLGYKSSLAQCPFPYADLFSL
jgi:hypothetical protein